MMPQKELLLKRERVVLLLGNDGDIVCTRFGASTGRS